MALYIHRCRFWSRLAVGVGSWNLFGIGSGNVNQRKELGLVNFRTAKVLEVYLWLQKITCVDLSDASFAVHDISKARYTWCISKIQNSPWYNTENYAVKVSPGALGTSRCKQWVDGGVISVAQQNVLKHILVLEVSKFKKKNYPKYLTARAQMGVSGRKGGSGYKAAASIRAQVSTRMQVDTRAQANVWVCPSHLHVPFRPGHALCTYLCPLLPFMPACTFTPAQVYHHVFNVFYVSIWSNYTLSSISLWVLNGFARTFTTDAVSMRQSKYGVATLCFD